MAETPQDLEDLYIDELKDLWSANDQMLQALKRIAPKASEPKLKAMLDKSLTGIQRHTDMLKGLIEDNGEEAEPEHCRGMEGLVREALIHTGVQGGEGPEEGPVLDAQIIAQYQRMTHYGIAGFGTAAAYAEALGATEDAEALNKATKEIYNGDEYATRLAETLVNLQAADEDED